MATLRNKWIWKNDARSGEDKIKRRQDRRNRYYTSNQEEWHPKGQEDHLWKILQWYQTTKSETHQTRLAAGGDQLDYEGKTSTDAAGLETIKIHINSTISRKETKYMCIDIGNMYLNTKLLSPEYMRILIDLIPEEIQHEYNTKAFADKDGCTHIYVHVYMEVTGAIYGLSQSGYLANQDLIKNLATYIYIHIYHIVNQWVKLS
jgi:hypothetical protein